MFGLHQDQSGPIPRGVWRQSTSALRYGCFMMFHEFPAMIPRRQCLMLTHGAHDFLVVSPQGVSRCLIPRWMRQTFIHWRHCISQQHREVPISIFVTISDPNWENQRDQKVKLKSRSKWLSQTYLGKDIGVVAIWWRPRQTWSRRRHTVRLLQCMDSLSWNLMKCRVGRFVHRNLVSQRTAANALRLTLPWRVGATWRSQKRFKSSSLDRLLIRLRNMKCREQHSKA